MSTAMNENQRRIDKEQIERLEKELGECHAGYRSVYQTVEALKTKIKEAHANLESHAALIKELQRQGELVQRQIGMHEQIVTQMYTELRSQEPKILEAQSFLRRLSDLQSEIRSSDRHAH